MERDLQSVKALVEISDSLSLTNLPDELFYLHLKRGFQPVLKTKYKPRLKYYIQPCLRPNYAQGIRKEHVRGKSLTMGEEGKVVKGGNEKRKRKGMDRSMEMGRLLAGKCRCMFLGGGGFKITSSDTPCKSRLCINRSRTKYDWSPNMCSPLPLTPKRSKGVSGLLPLHYRRPLPIITRNTSESFSDFPAHPHYPVKLQTSYTHLLPQYY